jgi:acid phosphatase (class A)
MFHIIAAIQDILLDNKKKKFHDLKYKNFRYSKRPTELEKKIPFNYFVIDQPPNNESDLTKQELDEVFSSSQNRNKEIEETILLIDKDPLIIYKHFLKVKNLEFPQQKFDEMYDILYDIIKDLKIYFNRPRPNQIAEFYNLNINVLNTHTHDTPSYPSGHVAYAKLAELLIKDTYPNLDGDLIKITEKVKLARIKQGVHFPSDNEASEKLVTMIYKSLYNFNPLF